MFQLPCGRLLQRRVCGLSCAVGREGRTEQEQDVKREQQMFHRVWHFGSPNIRFDMSDMFGDNSLSIGSVSDGFGLSGRGRSEPKNTGENGRYIHVGNYIRLYSVLYVCRVFNLFRSASPCPEKLPVSCAERHAGPMGEVIVRSGESRT